MLGVLRLTGETSQVLDDLWQCLSILPRPALLPLKKGPGLATGALIKPIRKRDQRRVDSDTAAALAFAALAFGSLLAAALAGGTRAGWAGRGGGGGA